MVSVQSSIFKMCDLSAAAPSLICEMKYFLHAPQNFKPDQRSGRCGVSTLLTTLLTTLCSTPDCYLRPDLSRLPIASRDYNSRYYQDSIYYSSRRLPTQVGLAVIAPRELLGRNKALTEDMLCSRTSSITKQRTRGLVG